MAQIVNCPTCQATRHASAVCPEDLQPGVQVYLAAPAEEGPFRVLGRTHRSLAVISANGYGSTVHVDRVTAILQPAAVVR